MISNEDKARVDSLVEVDDYRNGGIPWPAGAASRRGLPYVVRAAMK